VHYHLVPDGAGCRLTIDYHFTLLDKHQMFLLRLAKLLVKHELGKMWDGYVAAMARELSAG
jgi:hypothetical protein